MWEEKQSSHERWATCSGSIDLTFTSKSFMRQLFFLVFFWSPNTHPFNKIYKNVQLYPGCSWGLAQHTFGMSGWRVCKGSWVMVMGCGLIGKLEVLLGVVLAVGVQAGRKERPSGVLSYHSSVIHTVSMFCYFKLRTWPSSSLLFT